jgi:hypothetical protein
MIQTVIPNALLLQHFRYISPPTNWFRIQVYCSTERDCKVIILKQRGGTGGARAFGHFKEVVADAVFGLRDLACFIVVFVC